MKLTIISVILSLALSHGSIPYKTINTLSSGSHSTETNSSMAEDLARMKDGLSSEIHYSQSNDEVTRVGINYDYPEGLVFTPNGTDVALTFANYPLEIYLTPNKNVIRSEDPLTNGQKASMANEIANIGFNGIELISEANSSYNCHSYAWYNQDVANNNIWIQYPYDYYSSEDGSYMEVDTPKIGDIIVYFDTDRWLERKEAIHSGIVVGLSGEPANNNCEDANTVIVESKWGDYPLYRHKGDECPYTANYYGDADEVRYYRPRFTFANYLSHSMSDSVITSTIFSEGHIIDTYEMFELNVTESGFYDFSIVSDYEMNIQLFDAHMHEISIDFFENINYNYLYILEFSAGTYYLRIRFTEDHTSQVRTYLGYHDEHTYHCLPVNATYHTYKCACGNTLENEEHAFKVSNIVDEDGNRYSECISCGLLKKPSIVGPFFPIIKSKITDE